MTAGSLYDILEVPADASPAVIRDAYRRRARLHHPDRRATADSPSDPDEMAAINEAYRVLSDPGRRAVYDAGLRGTGSAVPPSGRAPSHASDVSSDDRSHDSASRPGVMHPSHIGPARVPWRMLLFCGTLAIIAVVVLAQFTDPGAPPGPDGILRVGDCVAFEPNNDAREVACAPDGGEAEASRDLVVVAFIPFDATCPGLTEAHRDRQGMGIACVSIPE